MNVFVPGVATPQGSMKAFVVKGRAIVTSDNAATKPWRADVRSFVMAKIGNTVVYPEGPVSIGLWFILPRRKAEPKRITPPHTRKPDLDKLARACLDALTGVLYGDDSQVTTFHELGKITAAINEIPGVVISWMRPGDEQETT